MHVGNKFAQLHTLATFIVFGERIEQAVHSLLYSSLFPKIIVANNIFYTKPMESFAQDWEQPEHIVDADAKKPEDWDDEMDGDWEAPMVDNPDYKGEWAPKQIKNPDYKGKWVHPMIDNPEYEQDDQLYKYDDFGAIGLDLWQVSKATIGLEQHNVSI